MTEDKRTEFAMAAVDFASLFNNAFSSENLAGYRISLTAPEGQSTGGGVQALQHITLSNDADGKTIVVGSCNNVEKTAELRSYEQVNQQYAQRYGGQAFPVEQQVYDELVKKLSEFFSNQSLQVVIIKPPVGQPPGPAALKTGSSAGLIIVLVILALIVAAGLIYYFGFYESS